MPPPSNFGLEGCPHPQGRRLAGVQRCLRTTDLDEVGDDRHLTVFQMLGSWSLGDYDGPQSLRWGWELLTDGLGIGRDRLHATVFGGDDQVGPDLASWQTWTELGVPVERLGPDNWWFNGPVGPCGPDSELFAWTGDGPPQGTPGTDGRWMGYSQDKPKTRSRKRFPWSAGVPANRAGGLPRGSSQSFREDSFSEANPALTSENPELSARKTWSTASENRQPLWRPDPATRTGEGLDAWRGRPTVGFVLILAVPHDPSRSLKLPQQRDRPC